MRVAVALVPPSVLTEPEGVRTVFQDDRMISILSAVVLMVAIGTVIQRADIFQDMLGDGHELVLNPDQVQAQPNRLLRVDVLRNDEGLDEEDRNHLVVVAPPKCGRVFLQGAVLQYLPDSTCVGTQKILYGIDGKGDAVGEVVAQMFSAEGLPLGIPIAGAPTKLNVPQEGTSARAAEPQE